MRAKARVELREQWVRIGDCACTQKAVHALRRRGMSSDASCSEDGDEGEARVEERDRVGEQPAAVVGVERGDEEERGGVRAPQHLGVRVKGEGEDEVDGEGDGEGWRRGREWRRPSATRGQMHAHVEIATCGDRMEMEGDGGNAISTETVPARTRM